MTTIEKIRAALLEIRYENKTSDPVTVTAICQKAGIARSTFYSYYDSPDDVLQDIYDATFAKMDEIDQNAKASPHQIEISTLDTLRTIYYYRIAYIVLMGDYGENIFRVRSRRHIEDHLKALMKTEDNPADELKIRFIAEGILADILLWLEKYPDITPERMTDYLLEQVTENYKGKTTKE